MELRKRKAHSRESNESKRRKSQSMLETPVSSYRRTSSSRSKINLRLNIRTPTGNQAQKSLLLHTSDSGCNGSPGSTGRGNLSQCTDLQLQQVQSSRTSDSSPDQSEKHGQREIIRDSVRRRSARIASREASEKSAASNGSRYLRPPKFQAARGLFTSLMADAKIRSVDPLRCISIPELRIRDICKWAVQAIKSSLAGIGDTESLVRGFISTGKYSIITPVPEKYQYLVVNLLESSGKSREDADICARSDTWYHVVDGGHLHRSLVEKINEEPNIYGGFRWPVVEICWQPFSVLKSLARMCQEMQKEVHLIEFTLPEVILNLRTVIDETLVQQGIVHKPNKSLPHGTIKKILNAYTGGSDAASSTLRSICSVALKISTNCIREIKGLLTEECADYLRVLGPSRPFGSDSRVFKKLLSTQSLRGAKLFLDQGKTTDETRVNVIHRLRHIAKVKQNFKGFASAEVDSQTERASAAKRAENQFQQVLGTEIWPEEMQHLRTNLLRTTILDEEVQKWSDKSQKLLPELENAYIAATGAHGRQLISHYYRSVICNDETEIGAATSERQEELDADGGQKHVTVNELPHSSNATSSVKNSARLSDKTGDETSSLKPKESLDSDGRASSPAAAGSHDVGNNNDNDNDGRPDRATDLDVELVAGAGEGDTQFRSGCSKVNEKVEEVLLKAGIEVYKMDYAEYERNSCDIDNSFDMVLCEPFQKRPGEENSFMDEKAANSLLQFFRRVLVPGGFCFILLDWMLLRDWASFLATNQFELFKSPFRIIRDPSKFQKQRSNDCQEMVHDALVARKPGLHPAKFTWSKNSPFTHLPMCQFPRYCAAIDHVPPPAQKLTYKPTRTQVRPGEWSHDLFIEILQSFCREGGKVLDPFAGALTTGIACTLTGRSCVLLEREEKCLANAVPRLCNYVEATNQSSEILFSSNNPKQKDTRREGQNV